MQQRVSYVRFFITLALAVVYCACSAASQNGTVLSLKNKALRTFRAQDYSNVSQVIDLDLSNNRITDIEDFTFENFTNLEELNLQGNGLSRIAPNAFHGLTSLKELNLKGNELTKLSSRVFGPLASLRILELDNNKLEEIPRLNATTTIAFLYMRKNPIKHLEPNTLKKYKSLVRLYLSDTEIKELKDDVFKHNLQLTELHFDGSSLENIEENAFRGPKFLTELSLKGTNIRSLPQNGLQWIIYLNIKDVYQLWKIPVQALSRLESVFLTYSFHCCLLRSTHRDAPTFNGNFTTCQPPVPHVSVVNTTASTESGALHGLFDRFDLFKHLKGSKSNVSSKGNKNGGTSTNTEGHPQFGRNIVFTLPSRICPTNPPPSATKSPTHKINCSLEPDPFNPCENVMGGDALRICVWIVVIFAITGNAFKLLVILSNKRKVTISKVVMSSLAFANLCMGVYLAMLAVEDLTTLGEYQNYVKSWQYGAGCNVAGFLSLFSTELAAYTLTVITIERYYTIVHALKQERHLTLKQVTVLMIVGWLFAIIIAALPVFGVSSYSKVAICLPFEVSTDLNKAYVTFFLVTNGLAFFVVLFCYARMYCSLGGTSCSSTTRVESRVARRMALLVFVNFACWFPIALLALIAIYGESLLAVETSKFFLVFIYPINSLTNPYLYALSTKNFRIDAFALFGRCGVCKRKMTTMSKELRGEVEGVPTLTSTLASRPYTGSKSSLSSYRVGGLSPMGPSRKSSANSTTRSYQYSTKDKKTYSKLAECSLAPCSCFRRQNKGYNQHLTTPRTRLENNELNPKSENSTAIPRVRVSFSDTQFSPQAESDSADSLNKILAFRKTRAASVFLEGDVISDSLLSRAHSDKNCNGRKLSRGRPVSTEVDDAGSKDTGHKNSEGPVVMISSC